MIVVGARLIYLQTAQHNWLSGRAAQQQQQNFEALAGRGLVVDRAGRELARSINTESFFAVPHEVKNIEAAAAALAPVINVNTTVLVARLREAKEANRKFVWVARKLAAAEAAQIKELNISGLHTLKEPKRFYPKGTLAAHVLGFVGIDETGLAGIEQFHNVALSGERGRLSVEGDAHHRPYESIEDVPSQAGRSIVLTIDETVQYWTEQALAAALKRTGAKAGTVVVLDPHTGEMLALANAPTFDPNTAGKLAPEAYTNKALQYIYEPGSTFKIVAYAAALEEGLAHPSERINCQMGAINVAGRVVHDLHPYGELTLTDALAKSSNVAAIKLGQRVGNQRMYDYITRFGFGQQTGVELAGETKGLVRPVARWQPSSIGSIAIGQEIGVTPLQMAAAFGLLANDGVRVQPHLVREVRASSNGAVLVRATPDKQQAISANTAKALRSMLESVTLNGTARRAQLDEYSAAGKTGTAQKIDPRTRTYSETKHVASFVGFAPVENPAVVIAVVLDEPRGADHGGQVAAPVFREIAERILPYLNVNPDAQVKPSPNQEFVAEQKSISTEEHAALRGTTYKQEKSISGSAALATLPETRREWQGGEIVYALTGEGRRALQMPSLYGQSVRDAARICAQVGVILEVRGTGGSAVKQTPAPGASVEAGQVVQVNFGARQ